MTSLDRIADDLALAATLSPEERAALTVRAAAVVVALAGLRPKNRTAPRATVVTAC